MTKAADPFGEAIKGAVDFLEGAGRDCLARLKELKGGMEMEKEQVQHETNDAHLVDLFGPFRDGGYEVTVEGRSVPFLRAFQCGGRMYKDRPVVALLLDGRMSIDDVTIDELQRWGWLMANAMAISAGYTCFGPNARRANPFRVNDSEVR